MTIDSIQKERLKFLCRVVKKEGTYLTRTSERLFEEPFTIERAKSLDVDDDLSERLEAFISRFSRLQDTLGDKLLPNLLDALNEKKRTQIDNLDMAERLGWLPNVDDWQVMRQLRNQMVHEYIEDLKVLVSAVNTAYHFVPVLMTMEKNLREEMQHRGWD